MDDNDLCDHYILIWKLPGTGYTSYLFLYISLLLSKNVGNDIIQKNKCPVVI